MLVTVGGQRVTVVFGYKVHGFFKLWVSTAVYILMCPNLFLTLSAFGCQQYHNRSWALVMLHFAQVMLCLGSLCQTVCFKFQANLGNAQNVSIHFSPLCKLNFIV